MNNSSSNIEEKESSIGFIAIVLLLAFSNVFASSGAANALHFSERISVVALVCMLWLASNDMPPILERWWYGLCAFSVAIMSVLTILNYEPKAMQLCNLVVTFGIVFWVQLFSRMKWEIRDFWIIGISVCLLAFFLNYLFLPGRPWSGWNSNSSIVVVPIMFFAISSIWCSDFKYSHLTVVPIVIIYAGIITTLENRSSFYAVVVFVLMVILRFPVLQKKWFRVTYISIIIFNVAVPFFNSMIAQSDIFTEILGASSVGSTKGAGFNGREDLWALGTRYIAEHPVFGLNGVRLFYPHNFSIDLLMQYGWVGWLTFNSMVAAIMESAFREGSKYNVFLLAFMSIMLLNTFENYFSCCNMFVVFSYMLPAVALCIHRSGQYEANGYKIFES